jgi:hypothetical protein
LMQSRLQHLQLARRRRSGLSFSGMSPEGKRIA